jgi:protoporphyrinogen oxidase
MNLSKVYMQNEIQTKLDAIVIGAGLTGLTTAHTLKKRGKRVVVIEKEQRVGGQIHTYQQGDYTFESGPNTGVVSYPEVAELFHDLAQWGCSLEEAHEEARQRWIWKGTKFHAIPSSLIGAVRTPLFTWRDKFGILGEPFRRKGTNPDEDVASMVVRRLGKSYLDYAVDPFVSGVYAGNPHTLITRFALPKLYNLEQNYGSFIRGGIAKSKEKKSERERLATKKVFSAVGGLSRLTEALAQSVGESNIILGAKEVVVTPMDGQWQVSYKTATGETISICSQHVITTVGAYALKTMLPFVEETDMAAISALRYAPIIQVSVGLSNAHGVENKAFGGLIPTCEKQPFLGILFPSACFSQRCPTAGALYSFFIGGTNHTEMLDKTDAELQQMVCKGLTTMLGLPANVQPDMIRIFRHERAIPQYELSSGARFEAINRIEQAHKGLIIGGNLRDGIGMADRIRQAVRMGSQLA